MTAHFDGLTNEQLAQLRALKALPDDQIDTNVTGEVRDWSDGKRGVFYKPIK